MKRIQSIRDILVLIKGGGDIATGVAWRMKRVGFKVLITELTEPTVIRRKVAFAEAVYAGEVTVQGITAKMTKNKDEIYSIIEKGWVPVFVPSHQSIINSIKPTILVDAIIAKRNTGTSINDAPLVIALGPGFIAKVDAHVVIETNRGHYLGRVIEEGSAEENTGIPGEVMGKSVERVLRSPGVGKFRSTHSIGDLVKEGEVVGYVDKRPVYAKISGVIRGLIHDDLTVSEGYKIGDIDPRGSIDYCITISDKALAIAGGVMEASLTFLTKNDYI